MGRKVNVFGEVTFMMYAVSIDGMYSSAFIKANYYA
jgi:hypothetical protein